MVRRAGDARHEAHLKGKALRIPAYVDLPLPQSTLRLPSSAHGSATFGHRARGRKGSRFDGTGHKLAQPLGASSVLRDDARGTRSPAICASSSSRRRRSPRSRARASPPATSSCCPRSARPARAPSAWAHRSPPASPRAPIRAAGWCCRATCRWSQPATIVAVARALDIHPVAYAQHNGRRGHPVGFAAELYSELTALDRRRRCAAPGRALSGVRGRARRSGRPDRHRHRERSRSGARRRGRRARRARAPRSRAASLAWPGRRLRR